MIIYINPECSKCKEASRLLQAQGCEFEIRNYLEVPPTVAELRNLLRKLGCKVEELIRKKELLYLEKFSTQYYPDEEWLHILSKHPILLQRPIVIDGERAIIGRPPSLVLEFTLN